MGIYHLAHPRIVGEQKLKNLKVFINANGYSTFGKIDTQLLNSQVQAFFPAKVIKTNTLKYPGWLQGVPAHYVVIDEEKYKEVMK